MQSTSRRCQNQHRAALRRLTVLGARAVRQGPLALYKGFMPGWLRLGPWQLVFWCTYEQLRILTGIGGFK